MVNYHFAFRLGISVLTLTGILKKIGSGNDT